MMGGRLMTAKAIAARERRAERNDVRACAYCGDEFVATYASARSCSPKCARKAALLKRPDGVCPTCGGVVIGSRKTTYCSLTCRPPCGPRSQEWLEQAALKKAARAVGRAAEKEARHAAKTLAALADIAERTRACEICGAMFVATREALKPWGQARSWGRFCSKSCAGQERARRHKADVEASLGHGSKTCPRCQTTFDSHLAHTRFCSRDCSDAWHRSRGCERVRRHGRDRVRCLRPQVLERDGWTCGICHLSIRQDVDVQHPLALTMDHIVPLAVGGSDRLDNLQPAHRQCNVDKGDDLPAWWARSQRIDYAPAGQRLHSLSVGAHDER